MPYARNETKRIDFLQHMNRASQQACISKLSESSDDTHTWRLTCRPHGQQLRFTGSGRTCARPFATQSHKRSHPLACRVRPPLGLSFVRPHDKQAPCGRNKTERVDFFQNSSGAFGHEPCEPTQACTSKLSKSSSSRAGPLASITKVRGAQGFMQTFGKISQDMRTLSVTSFFAYDRVCSPQGSRANTMKALTNHRNHMIVSNT